MATFAFSGRTRGGESVAGERMGDSMEAVSAALRREQIQVTRIAPVAAKAAAAKKLRVRSVPAKNLAVFTCRWSSAWTSSATRKSTSTSSRSSCRPAPTSKAARRWPRR